MFFILNIVLIVVYKIDVWFNDKWSIEQHNLKNVNNCLNTSISFYLETSGGKRSTLYLNVVHFFNTSVN